MAEEHGRGGGGANARWSNHESLSTDSYRLPCLLLEPLIVPKIFLVPRIRPDSARRHLENGKVCVNGPFHGLRALKIRREHKIYFSAGIAGVEGSCFAEKCFCADCLVMGLAREGFLVSPGRSMAYRCQKHLKKKREETLNLQSRSSSVRD